MPDGHRFAVGAVEHLDGAVLAGLGHLALDHGLPPAPDLQVLGNAALQGHIAPLHAAGDLADDLLAFVVHNFVIHDFVLGPHTGSLGEESGQIAFQF